MTRSAVAAMEFAIPLSPETLALPFVHILLSGDATVLPQKNQLLAQGYIDRKLSAKTT